MRVCVSDDSCPRMPLVHRPVTVEGAVSVPRWFDGINSFVFTPSPSSTNDTAVEATDRLLANEIHRFADVIRVLSSLAARADDVFSGLLAECRLLADKTNRLNARLHSGLTERVQGLNAKTARRRT